jgi:hypothetical protein
MVTQRTHNFAFEADAVRQGTVSCRVRAPRRSSTRYANKKGDLFMKLAKFLLGAASFGIAVATINVQAESLRCNGDLAQIGDSKGSVLAKCGEPMLKDSVCVPVEPSTTAPGSDGKGTTVIVTPCETVDEWTYNPGSGQFYTTLRFERGTLKAMKYGARVP